MNELYHLFLVKKIKIILPSNKKKDKILIKNNAYNLLKFYF